LRWKKAYALRFVKVVVPSVPVWWQKLSLNCGSLKIKKLG
jgi:hypothetical protein